MKTVVLIRLEIEHGNDVDPFDVVDDLLDEGVPQESINECDCTVVSATTSEEVQ